MNNDMLLARGEDNGLNLAIGEPAFLELFLNKFYPFPINSFPTKYPASSGTKALRESFCEYLYEYIGIETSPDCVVVTNGAKQALSAGTAALLKEYQFSSFLHRSPYWLSYPTIAHQANLPFGYSEKSLIVNTSPNNPDGTTLDTDCHIWDAAYAADVYGFEKGEFPSFDVSVFSAAKLFAIGGARLGFATSYGVHVNNIAQYVESTTSGVSAASQEFVLGLLKNIKKNQVQYEESIGAAKHYLAKNTSYIDIIEPAISRKWGSLEEGGKGMFGLIEVEDPDKFDLALTKSGVKMVPGSACGLTTPGTYRINMGARAESLYEAFTALETAYESL